MRLTTKEAILYVVKELGVTSKYGIAKALTSEDLKVQPIQITNYLKGKHNMSEKVARRFEAVFGIEITDVYKRSNWSEIEKMVKEDI